MFAAISHLGGPVKPPNDGTPREILPPTPVKFPQCFPKSEGKLSTDVKALPIVDFLQSIHRPADIRLSHFEALGIHVIPDASAEDLIPDASFLPPVTKWNTVPQEDLLEANEQTRKPLNNGNLSPGIQTYRERQKELFTDNTAAFRTIRRIPVPAGETAARLGNAYEFYKNLEFFSSYWPDTSLPPPSEEEAKKKEEDETPTHLQTHVRSGTGSQLPPDYRQNLLTAFVKLVAYDFGCNVSFPRTEPRLHLTPTNPIKPPSYFNSSATFIYRTPTERPLARAGIVEGPVAALSARASTVFATEVDEHLDLAREVVAVLLTAQQRAREKKTEKRFGDAKWWACTPRWGGGAGGAIGKEGDREEALSLLSPTETKTPTPVDGSSASTPSPSFEVPIVAGPNPGSKIATEVKRAIGGINGPTPNKRSKKAKDDGTLPIYDAYRKMLPPGPTWDRKARYSAIGKVEGVGYDDVFLVSCLNHHVSFVRARAPEALLSVLEGEGKEGVGWGKVEMWRSRWFDMFIANERVEAMGLVWGMMGWMMRKVEVKGRKKGKGGVEDEDGGGDEEGEKMDLS